MRSFLRNSTAFSIIFHHFPITRSFVLVKCRQFSVLGLTRGSLGSLRPSGHRRTECENWILGRADKLVSLTERDFRCNFLESTLRHANSDGCRVAEVTQGGQLWLRRPNTYRIDNLSRYRFAANFSISGCRGCESAKWNC